MKKGIMLLSLITSIFSASAQIPDFSSYPVYTDSDLGLVYSPASSTFTIWAPTANAAELIFYKKGSGDAPITSHSLVKGENGVWKIKLDADLKGWFYTFRVKINDKWSDEITDPYAKAVGVNGKRAMVIDLQTTNPFDWEKDKSPLLKNPTDAIVYELHIRDASISPSSGIRNKGKFLGLTETGTKNPAGLSTGLDHIKELGVTHIHLLPFYDFNSIDESKPNVYYNWGYDPLNYNVPEGSYATNPYDGVTRIKEFKQLVKTFHDNGLSVVMDVVYNHTALTEKSNFNQLVPGYYYRQTKDGKFSNATACGNETASERPMFRKFMLESMKYWVEEYHVDGFRIDLMGVHDIETINLISRELHKIKPGILLYGEGWTADASPLPESLRAVKANASKLDRVAVFSDDIRDGLKGSVFSESDRGFVSGKPGMEESIKFGIVASCMHPQVNYKQVNYSKAPYAIAPSSVITYVECHDNHTLADKLMVSVPGEQEEYWRRTMQKLALSVVLTSQGISFLHAGTEFLRSKKGVENSYNSPDSINAIDWELKTKNDDVFNYVKALINFRKNHPALRMTSGKDIASNIRFLDAQPGMVIYQLDAKAAGDSLSQIMILFNGTTQKENIEIKSDWKMIMYNNHYQAQYNTVVGKVTIQPYSCSILIR